MRRLWSCTRAKMIASACTTSIRGRFPDRAFSIGDLVSDLPWDNWLSLINSEKVSSMVLEAGGDWSEYVKAAVLRLQKKFSTVQLRGADMIVHGNIPIAAGPEFFVGAGGGHGRDHGRRETG